MQRDVPGFVKKEMNLVVWYDLQAFLGGDLSSMDVTSMKDMIYMNIWYIYI